jgi:hypothetical protein
MRTSDTCRREQLTVVALALLVIGTSAQAPNDLEDLLARVGDRIEQYFARAQKIVFLETTTISHIGADLMPQGFSRVVESDVRVEASPADGDSDGSSETSVVRELRKINGRAPRPRDDRNNCLDPNPISPEPLAFLLPAQRGDYEFTWVGHGKGKEQGNVLIEFRELGSGKPSVKERTDKGEGCFTIDIPGRARGRVWIDASTYDVLRVDQRIYGLVDFRLPDSRNRRAAIDDRQVLERLDTSIRYKTVPFRDPEETVLLPESIETLMVVRGMQSYRMKQVFSQYRRFVTDARLVK